MGAWLAHVRFFRARARVTRAHKARRPRLLGEGAAFTCSLQLSVARVEDDRVDDGDDTAFGLREAQVAEAADDAANDALVRELGAAVLRGGDRARTVDDELHADTT